jgi:glucokinase
MPGVRAFFNLLKGKALPLTKPLPRTGVVLVGDIGGTNSRLQLYSVAAGAALMSGERAPGEVVFEKQYLNGDFDSFDSVLDRFLDEAKACTPSFAPPSTACFAVAGPVENNAVNFTNRNWVISGATLEATLGISKVRLVNDFVANGYGLLTLDESTECVTLQSAPKVSGAPMACVGAGTGLGECFSTAAEVGSAYETFASEGGHAEWTPRNALEIELLDFMKAKFNEKNRVSVERVISGPGLATVYEFYSGRFPSKVIPSVHSEIAAAGEMKGKVIATHAQAGAAFAPFCELCKMTMQTFAGAYGAEAGVAALKWIPLGGLYIAGGLTPKNLPLLRGADSPFMQAFHDKGRLSPLLKRVPLYAVLAEDIGQRGAHLVAFRLLIKDQEEQHAAPLDPSAIEFETVKHAWKGSYPRTLAISKTEVYTRDPLTGTITNRWPMDALRATLPTPGDAQRFVLRVVRGSDFFCGLGGGDLTFSATDSSQRLKILTTLDQSLPVAAA